MARAFDPGHLGRSPSRFDEQQLNMWQKEAVHRLSIDTAREWLGSVLPAGLEAGVVNAFIAAVLPNIVLPADARHWVDVVFGGELALEAGDEALVRGAGTEFFVAAVRAAAAKDNNWAAITGAVRAATGKKGAELFMPLRLALTGLAHGPELAPLLKAMPPGKAHERLARFT
jgi:nondiscriminating glutamyl-tRNA synthetase